jgi:hypothetical protein
VIDRLIEAQQRAVGIHRDRIAVLHGEIRRQAQERAAAELAARVAATEKFLAARDATATKLETAMADMGRLYFELIDRNLEIARQWGFSDNARRVGALGEAIIAREVSHALFAVGRQRNGFTRLPGPGKSALASSATHRAAPLPGGSPWHPAPCSR